MRLTGAPLKARDLGVDVLAERVACAVAARLAAPEGSPWLTTPEVAEYLRCSEHRVKQLASQRRIPVVKEGGRNLYNKSEINAWLTSGQAALR